MQEDEEFSSLRSEESPSDSADVELEDEDDDTVLGSLESSDSEYHSATEEQGALQGEAAADVGDDVLGGDVSFQMPGADTTGRSVDTVVRPLSCPVSFFGGCIAKESTATTCTRCGGVQKSGSGVQF